MSGFIIKTMSLIVKCLIAGKIKKRNIDISHLIVIIKAIKYARFCVFRNADATASREPDEISGLSQ